MRQLGLDIGTSFNKVDGVVVMFFNPGSDGENIRVKNNIFRWEANGFSQNFIGAAANLYLARTSISLPLLIKRHHHHRRTIAPYQLGMVNKGVDALFHRNGVNNPFALNAFQAFLDDIPFG
ncbi:Uncharacterised protein [Yersinia enterocolitica]|nr:Uncharacterised protein [Yersinia enterocolitica]